MDLEELRQSLNSSAAARTDFATLLKNQLAADGIQVNIDDDEGGTIKLEGPENLTQPQVAQAVEAILKNKGIEPIEVDPTLGPKPLNDAWNVVYKDGGWVVNGKGIRVLNQGDGI